MSKSTLFDIGSDILDVAVDSLSQTRTGNDEPMRTNVAWGTPPADGCDDDCHGQVSVNLASPQSPITHDFIRTSNRQDHFIVATAHYTITVFRCVPNMQDDGSPESAELLTDSARGLMSDLWCLMTGLYDAIQSHDLYASQQASNDVNIESVQSIDPSGGCGGFVVRLSVLINEDGPA